MTYCKWIKTLPRCSNQASKQWVLEIWWFPDKSLDLCQCGRHATQLPEKPNVGTNYVRRASKNLWGPKSELSKFSEEEIFQLQSWSDGIYWRNLLTKSQVSFLAFSLSFKTSKKPRPPQIWMWRLLWSILLITKPIQWPNTTLKICKTWHWHTPRNN